MSLAVNTGTVDQVGSISDDTRHRCHDMVVDLVEFAGLAGRDKERSVLLFLGGKDNTL